MRFHFNWILREGKSYQKSILFVNLKWLLRFKVPGKNEKQIGEIIYFKGPLEMNFVRTLKAL